MANLTPATTGITYEQLVSHLPEFADYKLSAEKLESFKSWVQIISKNFNPSGIEDEDIREYARALYIGHFALLRWLPANKITPALVLGDQSSQSASEGGVSLSYSRSSYGEFLQDPYLGYTTYGSELAYLLRTNAGSSIMVS